MQVKTGVDIIEVDRIQEAIERQGENFLNRIYTKKEIQYCENTGKMKYQHYAARFAAKEAIFKAISSCINSRNDALWKQIEILNDEYGKPIANIEEIGLENIESMDLSLSHIKNYAVANFVILLK